MPVDLNNDVLNRQIITGWIFPSNSLTIAQLQLSSLQRCTDLRQMYFYHDNDTADIEEVLNKSNSIVDGNEVPKVETTSDKGSFSAFLLPLQIYLDAREKGIKGYNPISITLGVILSNVFFY